MQDTQPTIKPIRLRRSTINSRSIAATYSSVSEISTNTNGPITLNRCFNPSTFSWPIIPATKNGSR
ncbi:hypothetical protein D3C81_2271590 [compost metagenome]